MKEKSYGLCPYLYVKGDYYILLNKTSRFSEWNFFKGKTEADETTIGTAIREFYEETNVFVPKELIEVEKCFYQQNNRKDVGIFLVPWEKIDQAKIEPNVQEIYQYEWVLVDDNVVLSKNQRAIYKEIKKHLENLKR